MPSLIGNKPNQVPTNGDLGTLAFEDHDNVKITGGEISGNIATTGLNIDSNTLVVDATNDRIGVGTASPTVRLDIRNTGGGAGSTLQIGSGQNDIGTIQFLNTTGSTVNSTITGNLDGGNAGGDLRFSTKPVSGSLTERVRVTGAGDVGIGLNNPATYGSRTNLYVAGSLGGAVLVGNPSKTLQGVMLGDSNNGVMDFGTTTNHPVKFITNNTERMRLDSSGNLGVGNTTPVARLTVTNNNTGSGNEQFVITSAANTDSRLRIGYNTASDYGVIQAVTLNTAFRNIAINPDGGNVGVGTASPTAMLDVNSNTVRVRTARTPASATATGNAGDICWDANYVYVCVATNTWKRSALSTW